MNLYIQPDLESCIIQQFLGYQDYYKLNHCCDCKKAYDDYELYDYLKKATKKGWKKVKNYNRFDPNFEPLNDDDYTIHVYAFAVNNILNTINTGLNKKDQERFQQILDQVSSQSQSEGEDLSFEEGEKNTHLSNHRKVYYDLKDKHAKYCNVVKKKKDKHSLNMKKEYFSFNKGYFCLAGIL